LDGSQSNDPDGTIVKFEWKRLPDESYIAGNEAIIEYKARGLAEEVIQLSVTDDKGGTATDTISIWHPYVKKDD
jgi:hypothetical protein